MRISFAKNDADVVPVINEKAIEVVPSVKPLGLSISNDLKWNFHASEISRKVSTRLYFLKQLKGVNMEAQDLEIFYATCLRLITEYSCAVFHNSIPIITSQTNWNTYRSVPCALSSHSQPSRTLWS